MKSPAVPLSRDLVLIGGGHAHALVLRMWGMEPLPGARLTLIDPNPVAPYTGMLPGRIAGHYRQSELEIDLVRLARFAGARLIVGAVTGIDAGARQIAVSGRGAIGYDVASVDVGIHSAMPALPGFAEHAVPAKPLGGFAAAWDRFVARSAAGEVAPRAAVIGGGIAGTELAMAMVHRLRAACGQAEVTLVERGDAIARETPRARPRLLRALAGQGVCLRTGVAVARVTAAGLVLADGGAVAAGLVVGAAGARAHRWIARTGLPVTADGFLRVGPDLRVEGRDDLFAVGDCAHLTHAPRPKAGVYAVRAAPVLRDNLRAVLSGRPTRPFHPQRDHLKLMSLGGKAALAEKLGVSVAGPLLWRWKDRIDRSFMARFDPLPAMPAPPRPPVTALDDDTGDTGDVPLCGGCGSKLAPGVLAGMLAAQPAPARPDVLTGPGDDAAVIAVAGTPLVLTTDHLRAFTEDFGLLARIAALHALGDIWAMGAAPQAALISVTLPQMSPTLQARTLAEIMTQAGDAIRAAGAEVVGGHSAMGTETTIGFTLTGVLTRAAITTAGARPGDALILTRPIGAGTLLAAEMRGLARGQDVADLISVLQRPQAGAADLLAHAHAMTDVTGFGLAGHLTAICRASGVAAVLDPAAVPVYAGARALADRGVRSSIWAANRAAFPVAGVGGAQAALLHDPQTAGGLLAAVDATSADAIVAALREAGHDAARIGAVAAGQPAVRLTGPRR